MRLPGHYPYVFIKNFNDSINGNSIPIKLFRFKSKKNRTYLVRVECYKYHVYAIKFYCKAHQHSKKKYSLLTGDNEPRRIVFTCMNILNEIFQSDNKSSFSFMGSPSIGENDSKTKRYKFYKVMVNTHFGVQTFSHHYYENKSAYLLIRNTVLSDTPSIVEDIKDEFVRIYQDEFTT